MRLVLDTNLLISALIRDGKPRNLLNTTLSKNHTIVLSNPILEEFSRIVAEERIRRYAGTVEAAGFLKTLVKSGEFVRLKSRFKVLGSPDDEILRTAYDAKADLVVTGDKHLLNLGSFRGIRIVTVSEALSDINRWFRFGSPIPTSSQCSPVQTDFSFCNSTPNTVTITSSSTVSINIGGTLHVTQPTNYRTLAVPLKIIT